MKIKRPKISIKTSFWEQPKKEISKVFDSFLLIMMVILLYLLTFYWHDIILRVSSIMIIIFIGVMKYSYWKYKKRIKEDGK